MEKINIYRKKISKIQEIELKQDLIVPDSKQDIFTILDGNFYCYFSKVDILNGKVKVNGNVDSYISYISSGEETVGLQTTFSFEDGFENDSIVEQMTMQYNIEVSKQEIKIINERKISIGITLKINYEVFGTDSIEIFNDFEKIEDVQINSRKINMKSLIGINSNVASLKEEIKKENSDIVVDILKVDTNIVNNEVKISYNKVLTKADFKVNILYLTQDGRVGRTEGSFPIMSFIDLEDIKEENSCSTDYQIRNILLNINNGEDNSINIQVEYEVVCKAFEDKEQEIVSDLYSLKYDTEFTSKELEILDASSSDNVEKVDISERIEIENIQNVIDVFGKSKVIKNNEGELELKVYYEAQNKIGLNIKTVNIPFIYKTNSNEIETEIQNLEFDLNNITLFVNGNIIIKQANKKSSTIKIVQDVVTKPYDLKNEFGMVVYIVKKNDCLWDISKKFKVKQENIIKANDLEEPYNLKYGEKIYIAR